MEFCFFSIVDCTDGGDECGTTNNAGCNTNMGKCECKTTYKFESGECKAKGINSPYQREQYTISIYCYSNKTISTYT